MVTFSFPTESGNVLVRSGKIQDIFANLAADLKPEAAYFYPVGGQRGGHFILNLKDSSEVASVPERFWFAMRANVEMTPVMSADDLQRGLSGIGEVIQKFG